MPQIHRRQAVAPREHSLTIDDVMHYLLATEEGMLACWASVMRENKPASTIQYAHAIHNAVQEPLSVSIRHNQLFMNALGPRRPAASCACACACACGAARARARHRGMELVSSVPKNPRACDVYVDVLI